MTQQTETMPSAKRTLTAANDYRSFLRALKKNKWAIEELTDEMPRPEKLHALVELMGAEKFEASLIRAFDNDHLDRETGEVLWVEHKKKPAPSPENGEPKLTGTGSDPLPPPPAPPVARTHEHIQNLVDEAVEKNGANILDRADCNEILSKFGLKREEVTERMVDRADSRAQKKLRETFAKANEKTSFPKKAIWEGDKELDPALNPDHPIRGAAAARRDMEERGRNSDNGDVQGHIMTEGDDDTFTFIGENEMKLSANAAKRMLTAAGVDCKTWGQKKLTAFLNDQESLVEATEPEDEKQKDRFNAILKAVADGNKIAVTEGLASVTKKTTEPKKKPKEGKGRKKRDGSMSCADAAYKVLSETGKEMTSEELVEVMAKKGYWSSPGTTPAATVGARIYVEINKGKESRFKKVGKGTFAAAK